jgi:restriction system protein
MASKKKEGAQFVRYFGPLLDALRELGGSARPAEASERVAMNLKLSQDEQDELLASGSPRFHNAVQWARFYLVREGHIDGSKKGVWSLTPIGWKTHLSHEQSRSIFLKWVDIFAKARKNKVVSETPDDVDIDDTVVDTPTSYRARVLEILRSIPPDAFERLCQRLLRESDFTSVTVTGRSGDGGIDGIGILQINPFVSFRVLFQCKRYTGSVSPSQVRDFRGAMLGRADKGIIITTGTFTQEARKEAFRDGAPPLELVDGDALIDMFEHLKFGLQPRITYEVDDRFFASFTNPEG